VLHQRSRTKRYGRILISEELLDMLAGEVPDEGRHDEYLDALEKCKSKLTESQRELIDFRYQRGRSIEDYAEQTGRKASALRVALMRIRIALRECVEKSVGGHPA
jgi:RNA polymerase sigma-70 factor (ECF subfamily)